MIEQIPQVEILKNKKNAPEAIKHNLNNLDHPILLEYAKDGDADSIISMEESILENIQTRTIKMEKFLPFFTTEIAKQIENFIEHINTFTLKKEKESDQKYCEGFLKYAQKLQKMRKDIIKNLG